MVEESEIDRKARIMALSSRAKAKKGEPTPSLNFRNYNIPAKEDEHTSKKQKTTDERKKKSELELALIEAKRQLALSKDGNNANSNLPKKINWDLKNDIASKISKLERRTQKAIVELLRERLEREASQADNLD